MNKKFYIYILCILTVLMTATLASCSDDSGNEEGGKGMVTVRGAISARGNLGTRASTYVDAANDRELINDWIIIVSQGGKIKKVIKREDYKKFIYDKQDGYRVDKEAFEFTIEAGTYDVYSFANLSTDQLREALGVTIAEGNNLPADMNSVTFDINSKVLVNGKVAGSLWVTFLPMSGSKHVTFTSSGLQSEEFEVIRMFAKVEFTYRNASTRDITLKYVKLSPVNKGIIRLLPDYSTLTYNGEKDPVLLAGAGTETVTDTYSEGTVLGAGTYATKSFTRGFYIRESLASSHPTKHFMLNVGIERSGKSEEIQYSLSSSTLTGINRNEYVKIPIKFTDYIVGLDVNFYPPIGGYPAVITTNNKQEFYCTFGTQGDFEIMPTVVNANTDAKVYFPQWDYNCTTDKDYSTAVFSVDDPNSIFTTTPHIDPSTGEILGKLNANTGTACITLEIKVEVSSGVWQVYPRRIYIIRSNS